MGENGPRAILFGAGRRACGDDAGGPGLHASATPYAVAHARAHGRACARNTSTDAPAYGESVTYATTYGNPDAGAYRGSCTPTCDVDSHTCHLGSRADDHGPSGEGHLQRAGGQRSVVRLRGR